MTEQEKSEETPNEEPAVAEEPKAEAKAEAAPPAKKEREIAPAGPDTAVLPSTGHEPGTPVVSRRSVLRVGFWSALGAIVTGTALCGVDLLYPRGVTGFGGVISVDAGEVPAPGGKTPIQRGRFWLVNLTEEQGGPGLLALWWKCPHLGCTVPWRENFIWPDAITGAPKQGWFRCPCHGSTYTDSGVRVFGPAPRSMDTMAVTVSGSGSISVNTGSITPGSPSNSDRVVQI